MEPVIYKPAVFLRELKLVVLKSNLDISLHNSKPDSRDF